jgi:hypothetical protein
LSFLLIVYQFRHPGILKGAFKNISYFKLPTKRMLVSQL